LPMAVWMSSMCTSGRAAQSLLWSSVLLDRPAWYQCLARQREGEAGERGEIVEKGRPGSVCVRERARRRERKR